MLTIPHVEWLAPAKLSDALRHLDEGSRGRIQNDGDVAARRGPVLPIAGGTDIVPNLKHRLLDVEKLVSLSAIQDAHLREIRDEKDGVHMGALVSLHDAGTDPLLEAYFPALTSGYRQIASPQIRNMGTVGGNLCLDTRCTYYNQTPFWRQSLGYCLKREGTQCHVVLGGTRCVAASSSDGATLLIALDAEARLENADGDKWIPVDKLFIGEGRRNLAIEPGELVTEIRVPHPPANTRMAYRKLRPRGAIDFPALSIATILRVGTGEVVESIRIVVAALGAKPRVVAGLDRFALGQRLDDDLLDRIAAHCHKQCRPLTNVPIDVEWRHQMVPVLVRRALEEAVGDGAGNGGGA